MRFIEGLREAVETVTNLSTRSHAFVILAAFTYSSGLRAPASIAIVKDILIYLTAFAAVIVIPIEFGGFGKIFAAAPNIASALHEPSYRNTDEYNDPEHEAINHGRLSRELL